jgi:tellurite resistance protein TehA-like permease
VCVFVCVFFFLCLCVCVCIIHRHRHTDTQTHRHADTDTSSRFLGVPLFSLSGSWITSLLYAPIYIHIDILYITYMYMYYYISPLPDNRPHTHRLHYAAYKVTYMPPPRTGYRVGLCGKECVVTTTHSML